MISFYIIRHGETLLNRLNKRLPDVAAAIYGYDTTGMTEPF